MARINLDDEFFGDRRLDYLAQISGEDRCTTDGRMIRIFNFGVTKMIVSMSSEDVDIQARWFNPERGPFAELLVKAKLATKQEDDTYKIKGIEDRMQWLVELSATKREGGKKRAAGAVRDSKGRMTPKETKRDATLHQHMLDSTQQADQLAGGKPPAAPAAPSVLSLALVLDPVLDLSPVQEKKKKERGATAPDGAALTAATWIAYSDAYSHRYGTEPVANATVRGQLAQFVKRLGKDAAPGVAAFYVSHNNQFYVRTMHPVGILLKDAEKLHTEWITGQKMLSSQAREVETREHNRNVFVDAAKRIQERTKPDGT